MNKSVISLHRLGSGIGALIPLNQVTDIFANLPPFGDNLGKYWQVDNPTGTRILFNYKASGVYKAEATKWRYIGDFQLLLNDDQFSIYNAADNTKVIDFDVSGITTGTQRTAKWQDKDGTVAYKVGVQSFFISATGAFGTGGGWADSGFINDTPVLLFSPITDERAIFMFFGLSRLKLDAVDPQIGFVIYSTGAPLLDDDVKWELQAKYVADTESTGGAADETIEQIDTLTTLVLNSRQTLLLFTLDRTKISIQDSMKFILTRKGGDGVNDTYGSDIGVGQSGIIVETFDVNP